MMLTVFMMQSLRNDPHTGSFCLNFRPIQTKFGYIRLHICKNGSLIVLAIELASRYLDAARSPSTTRLLSLLASQSRSMSPTV